MQTISTMQVVKLLRNKVRFKEILLVSLDWCRPKDPPISLGSASILSNLLKQGVAAKSLSYNVNNLHFNVDHVIQDIFDHKPSKTTLVALGTFIWNEVHIQTILKLLDKYKFSGTVLLGGPQISYTTVHPQMYYSNVDIFCRGYAEQAVHKLMTQATDDDPCPQIGGIVYKGMPDMKMQAMCELENLPSPLLEGTLLPQNFLRWETQRGCPFRCAFCQHRESDLTTVAGLQRRKQFNASRLQEEIRLFCRHNVSDIAVLDPTFNSGPTYLSVLDEFIENNFQGKLSLQCRFEMVKDEFLQKISLLNSQGAKATLEFGLQTAIKSEAKAIHRPNHLNKVREVVHDLHKMDIPFEVSLIFGLPLQTLDSFRKSVNFCLQLNIPSIKAWPLMLLRGTPLDSRESRQKYQLKEKSISASEEIDRVQVDIPHVVESSTFSYNDWLEMADIAAKLAKTEGDHPKSV